jgi:Trypsin-like peptidase domain
MGSTLRFCLTTAAFAGFLHVCGALAGAEPWSATAWIQRDGRGNGSGVYLKNGLVLTAAHLTDPNVPMGVQISGFTVPATVLKQGSVDEVDLSLLAFDETQIKSRAALPPVSLCTAPPWPGDDVIVIDARTATRSHIVSPQMLPFSMRTRFPTLIGDVATTGASGSGVFDPHNKCLLGIMSQKIFSRTPEGDKDLAKYFVGADAIRRFLPTDPTRSGVGTQVR